MTRDEIMSLSGADFDAAVARAMGWRWYLAYADDDYSVLEHVRRTYTLQRQHRFCAELTTLWLNRRAPGHELLRYAVVEYMPGDYGRALLLATHASAEPAAVG